MCEKLVSYKEFSETFDVPMERKKEYGEINTPFSLCRIMIDLLPKDFIDDPNSMWIDPACGSGHFPMMLFSRLMESLDNSIVENYERQRHIIENMLFLYEKNPIHREKIIKLFGKHANIKIHDFLQISRNDLDRKEKQRMCIIGNPPYNSGGLIKVPTNKTLEKKADGKALWKRFISHSIQLMNERDYLVMVVPSLWMRPDKEGIYDVMCKYKIHNVRCFTNTESNRIFHGKAQTPTSIFLLEKSPNDFSVSLYNNHISSYQSYQYSSKEALPLLGSSIVSKVRKFTYMYGMLPIYKTNMPGKHTLLSETSDDIYKYKNIHTCVLRDKLDPSLVIKHSNKECSFYGVKKLVMAHKMYGFPYFDCSGEYGISNRDAYVLSHDSFTNADYKILQHFLSSPLVLYIFETTRYRMKYLEKQAFQYIPDITKIPCDYISNISYLSLYDLFSLSELEVKTIERFHKRKYNSFIDS